MKYKLDYEGPIDNSGRRERHETSAEAKARKASEGQSNESGNATFAANGGDFPQSNTGGGGWYDALMGVVRPKSYEEVLAERQTYCPSCDDGVCGVDDQSIRDRARKAAEAASRAKQEQEEERRREQKAYEDLQEAIRRKREQAQRAQAQQAQAQRKAERSRVGSAKKDFETFWNRWKGNDTSTIRRAAAVHFPGFTRMDPHDQEVMTLVNSRCDEIERANRRR